jgi:hypothetical protein
MTSEGSTSRPLVTYNKRARNMMEVIAISTPWFEHYPEFSEANQPAVLLEIVM